MKKCKNKKEKQFECPKIYEWPVFSVSLKGRSIVKTC